MPNKEEAEKLETEQPKKRSRLKGILFLLFLFFFILGILGGAYWWFFIHTGALSLSNIFGGNKDVVQEQSTQDSSQTEKDKARDSKAPQPVLKPISLPSFTVNLSDPSGNKYLRIAIDVEVSAADAISTLEAQGPRVRDAIILLLSNKTSGELIAAEGKVILKNEIADRLNQILGAPRVVRIYFTDFVIQ